MRCSFLALILYVTFANPLELNGQSQIFGSIKNNTAEAIQNASVVVYDSTQQILAYSYSNEKGNYEIGVNKAYPYLIISAQSLGYKKAIDTIHISLDILTYNKSFILQDKIEELNEVLLKPQEKIAKKGDTIVYKVKAFKDGTEQTVEDVLKRLPGVEVLKDGTIKAHGRFIDKLLVEGEDMFDKNYKVLSQNLDANVLNSVEILQDFEDNPVLAKVLKSEKIAINLVLKENYKNIWFGNAGLGVGTEERFKLASNIGLIKKKIKLFNFNNYNNLGLKALDQVEGVQSSKTSFFDETRAQPNITSVYTIQDNNNTIFEDGESTFNNAFINSLSFVTSLNEKTKLRGTGYYTNDDEEQFFSSQTTFNTESQTNINYSENSFLEKKNTVGGGELELKYSKDEKSYFKNSFIYNNKPERINHNAVFNGSVVSESLKQKEFSVYNHFNYSRLLGEKDVLHSYVYFGTNSVTQSANVISPSIDEAFSQFDVSSVKHSSNDNLTVFGGRFSMLINLGKIDSNFEFGYENNLEERNNDFFLSEANNVIRIDSLQNKLRFRQNKIKLKGEFKYSISKNIEMFTKLSLDFIDFKVNNSASKVLLFNPRLRLAFKNLKIGYFSLSYGHGYREPKSYLFLKNYQLNTYQSLRNGTEKIAFPTNDTFGLYYQISNELQTNIFSFRMQYLVTNDNYSTRNQIGENLILTSYSLLNSGNVFSGNLDYTNYFKALNFSTKIGTSQSISVMPISANSSGVKKLRTVRSSYFLTGRTYFKFPINMSFKGSINSVESDFNQTQSRANWQRYDIDVVSKPSKTWISTLSSNFYLLSNSSYSFFNLIVDHTPKASKFSYQFKVNNITDENIYSIVDVNDFSSFESNIRLLPRYFFGSVKYRF